MPLRHTQSSELFPVVVSDSAAPVGLMTTADTVSATVAARQAWIREFDPAWRPLWALTDALTQAISGRPSLRQYYGRPAHAAPIGRTMFGRQLG